jgi:hypothetical protein
MILFLLRPVVLSLLLLLLTQSSLSQRIIIPDDFKVTDSMLATGINQDAREIKFGSVTSLDMVWFGNRSLNQTLIVQLYTDDFRNAIYLLKNDDIPGDLLSKIEFVNDDGDRAPIAAIKNHIAEFVKASKQIAKHFFVSQKGFRIGEDTTRAFLIYGLPAKKTTKGNLVKYQWDFPGENSGESKNKKQAMAKESFGYQVTIFFRNGLLTGLILHNDIP